MTKTRKTASGRKGAGTRRLPGVQPTTHQQTRRTAKGRKGAAKKAPAVPRILAAADSTQTNLHKINHLVVLMLENRSFDHMLGYLSLTGALPGVDGLAPGMENRYEGTSYPIHHLQQTAFASNQDPCHRGACVTEQLGAENGGFVQNYAKTHPRDSHPGRVMGYYDSTELLTYDHLAREFCVCDKWFSSVPGATWPNRLYAVTGHAADSKDNKTPPLYKLPSFIRHLDARHISWRWYAHDIATLRLIDDEYFMGHFTHFYHFEKVPSWLLGKPKTFLDHAAAGDLAAVSWIDPKYTDWGSPTAGNDDHPPADVRAGQELVFMVYHALVTSPAWEQTVLVVLYDEHGGFYDHVSPHSVGPAADDSVAFRTYGVRVPALIVSPWVGRGSVSHMVFDHTSIIKTVLLRFCQRRDGRIPDMGARVTAANHIGSLLTEATARPPTASTTYQPVIDQIAQWKSDQYRSQVHARSAKDHVPSQPLTDFQQGLLAAQQRLRRHGLPPGQL